MNLSIVIVYEAYEGCMKLSIVIVYEAYEGCMKLSIVIVYEEIIFKSFVTTRKKRK